MNIFHKKIHINTNDEGSEMVNIILCSTNNELKKMLHESKDVAVFFSDDSNIDAKNYDLILVDVDICDTKLDVAKVQTDRTVFILPELTDEGLEKVLNNFKLGVIPFDYKFYGKKYTVDLNDIAYFESRHKIIRGYNDRGEFIRFYKKLDDLEKEVAFSAKFIRINKSHLANIDYCTLKNDKITVLSKEVQISRTRKKELIRRLKQ